MWKLSGINIWDTISGGYYVDWNGSTTAPKIQAYTTVPGTEATAATNLSSVTITGELVYGN
jgi:hypothetical protein